MQDPCVCLLNRAAPERDVPRTPSAEADLNITNYRSPHGVPVAGWWARHHPFRQLPADDPRRSADGVCVRSPAGRERVRWGMEIRGAEKGYCAGSALMLLSRTPTFFGESQVPGSGPGVPSPTPPLIVKGRSCRTGVKVSGMPKLPIHSSKDNTHAITRK